MTYSIGLFGNIKHHQTFFKLILGKFHWGPFKYLGGKRVSLITINSIRRTRITAILTNAGRMHCNVAMPCLVAFASLPTACIISAGYYAQFKSSQMNNTNSGSSKNMVPLWYQVVHYGTKWILFIWTKAMLLFSQKIQTKKSLSLWTM